MSKPPLQLSPAKPDHATAWPLAGKRAISLTITLCLGLLALVSLSGTPFSPPGRLVWGIGLLANSGALTMALERALSSFPIASGRRYRLAFYGSAGFLLGLWAARWVYTSQMPWPWFLAGILGGSFTGGLLATVLNDRLWENNSPPSEEIGREVHLRHLAFIGLPGPMPPAKRAFDLVFALVGAILSTPVWLLSAFLIWVEDPGPILFIKNSVGRGGKNFHQFKFRTMVRGAEDVTGPVLAGEQDARVLRAGRFLRKTALDELPQLLNILLGQMSFVGPRPQRTVLVYSYLERMPEYAERHRVLPGLAGLAQVAGDYYLTPRQKLRFDRIYIRYASLGFDLKLILLAFSITFWYRWRKDWNGRLPRKLLRMGN